MIRVLLFFLLPLLANGAIQVPFQGVYGEYDLHFNLTIGTPGQQVRIRFYDNFERPDLFLPDATVYSSGFNPNASTSFVETGRWVDNVWKNETGINGTDTFTINGVIIKEKPLLVLKSFISSDVRTGFMGIKRHDGIYSNCPNRRGGCTSFVQSVLRDQEQNVLSLAFDTINPRDEKFYTGQLSFGDQLPALCDKNQWGYMKEVTNVMLSHEQWTFDVDKITVDKYSFLAPGQAVISFDYEELFLPKPLYVKIMHALGSTDMVNIPCSNAVDIVFQLGGKDFRIPPDVYMFPHSQKEGMCGTWMISQLWDNIQIPATAFSQHCISFDYDKIQLGFTTRVQQ